MLTKIIQRIIFALIAFSGSAHAANGWIFGEPPKPNISGASNAALVVVFGFFVSGVIIGALLIGKHNDNDNIVS